MAEIGEDQHVFIPQEVRDKIERGQAAYKAMMNGEQQPEPQPEQQPQPEPQPEQQPEPQPELQTEPQPEPQPEQHDDGDDAEQLRKQLHTIRGRYNSEVRRLRGEAEEQAKVTQNLQRQLTELTAQLVKKSEITPEKKSLTGGSDYGNITPEELKDYGPQFFDMIARVAEEVSSRAVASQLSEIKPKVDNLTSHVDTLGRSSEEQKITRLHAWLDTNLPSWREQDDDPLFLDWLKQVDPFSGVARFNIFKDAMDKEQYSRVKMIFEGFVTEQEATAPIPRARSKTATGQTRIGNLASPNGGRGRTVPIITTDAPEAPLSSSDIKRYYDRKVRNPKSLTEAEITQMEARIKRSLASGNIRGGQSRY